MHVIPEKLFSLTCSTIPPDATIIFDIELLKLSWGLNLLEMDNSQKNMDKVLTYVLDIMNKVLFHGHFGQGVILWTSWTICYFIDIINKVLMHGHLWQGVIPWIFWTRCYFVDILKRCCIMDIRYSLLISNDGLWYSCACVQLGLTANSFKHCDWFIGKIFIAYIKCAT